MRRTGEESEIGSRWSGWVARGGLGEAGRVGCCWVPAADAGMTFGEGRGARGDWAGSEEPMDADGQAFKGLWCWLDDRFGAVRARGRGGQFRSCSSGDIDVELPGLHPL